MKRFPRLCPLLFAFTLLSTPLFAEDFKSLPPTKVQNPDTGYLATTDAFRGIKYGSAVSSLTGMKLDMDQGPIKLYTRKGEKLFLGPVKLEAVVYHFFNDKFYGVSLHTDNLASTQLLLRVAQTLFGNGSNPNGEQEIWKGKKLSAIYSVNPENHSGVLILHDNALESEKETFLSKASEDALKDL